MWFNMQNGNVVTGNEPWDKDMMITTKRYPVETNAVTIAKFVEFTHNAEFQSIRI